MKFFDSMYNEKLINIDQIMEHVNKDTHFRNVYLFVERAKNIATIQDDQHMRNNLFTFFKEFALQ